ncbi:hypothetical protein HTZ84_11890 [Haloterrigena sp. SYSU A558-1]|uniref:CRISPR-associated protein Cmr3 n=1 Tax=Haloterrigena gelatinilytica TaxID=2741724 RepID=A0ABX2LC90_9EURY|nr:hypothetical protein [Haloterrigena gelatinilytica]
MTRLQQVLFKLDGQYLGHPYFVTGNALFNAIARRVDEQVARALNVSHGVFLPGEYGEYPLAASQDGYAGKLGQSLPEVEAYEDLFVFRDPAHRWLLDSRPRDAHNTHPLQVHGDRVAFDSTCWFGRPKKMRDHRRSVSWYLHCYVHAQPGDDDVLPVSTDVLNGVQVGGARNYEFGKLSVAETQVVDVEALDFSRLEAAQRSDESCWIELVTPFVLETEHPCGDAQSIPWWWGVDKSELRCRETRFVDGDETYAVTTVDHGQLVPYTGPNPVRTAVNGVYRVGTHSRFGFGELRVWPPGADRVPERVVDREGDAA